MLRLHCGTVLDALSSLLLIIFVLNFGRGFADLDLSQINVNNLQGLSGEVNKANFKFDDVKTLMRNKCIETAGEELGDKAYQDIESGILSLGECVNDIANYTAIQKEIDQARPNGELDVVFNKYCKKRPKALECIETFNSKLVPCLDEEEHKSQNVLMRIITSLLNFICYKGGDQIALFIAEKGPECLESKKDDIQNCINKTFSGYIPNDGLESVKTIPKLIMSPKQCKDIEALETCIVASLEHCQEITPANIVESMFRFIKNETVCRNNPGTVTSSKQVTTNGSNTAITSNKYSLQIAYFTALFTLLFCLWLK